MSKKPFYVGQKVAYVYGTGDFEDRIIRINEQGILVMKESLLYIHPRQVTKRWVKKPKPEPREFWVNIYKHGPTCPYSTRMAADKAANDDRIECIHVREVLK